MTDPLLIQRRTDQLFTEHQERTWRSIDRFFVALMLVQFVAGVIFALVVSPRTWSGALSRVHFHVWTALLLGALIPAFPIVLVWRLPGRFITRCVIASAQMLVSALLIHLTGGRIETHFHVFGSLAFLAFYRDWRILIPATIVVGVDHAVRGYFWPESVYGVLSASVWRSVEHAAWVVFEDVVLVLGCLRSVREARAVAAAQAALEHTNAAIESRVDERTRELARKSSELTDANVQIQAILDGAADAIITIDSGGTILSFNMAAERIFGYARTEAIGMNVKALMPSPDRERHDDYLRRYLATGEKRVIDSLREVVARRKDGSQFPADLRVSHVMVSGKPMFTGLLRDITARKEAEAARLDRERATALVADVAVALNMGGTLRTVLQKCSSAIVERLDAAFARIWTVDAEGATLELQASAGMYTHIDGGHARVPIGQFKIGRIAQLRQPHLTNDVYSDPHVGDPQWARREGLVAFAGYPLIVDDVLVGVVALFSRNTLSAPTLEALGAAAENIASGIGRKLAEERLTKTQSQLLTAWRMAGMAEVATGVLHNVGNALNSVNVSAGLVRERLRELKIANLAKAASLLRDNAGRLGQYLETDDAGKRLPGYLLKLTESMANEQSAICAELGVLAERVDHIKSIVSTQQEYARAGGLIEDLSIAETLEAALKMYLQRADRHGIAIVREFAELPPIQADKHKLGQILLNLIGNAVQAMRDPSIKKREMKLRARVEAEQIIIDVCDTGVGIPEEHLTRIFSYGFTTKKDGHGFGLHSSANAAREMGGSLTVRSDGPGAGATFTLELPLRRVEANA